MSDTHEAKPRPWPKPSQIKLMICFLTFSMSLTSIRLNVEWFSGANIFFFSSVEAPTCLLGGLSPPSREAGSVLTRPFAACPLSPPRFTLLLSSQQMPKCPKINAPVEVTVSLTPLPDHLQGLSISGWAVLPISFRSSSCISSRIFSFLTR